MTNTEVRQILSSYLNLSGLERIKKDRLDAAKTELERAKKAINESIENAWFQKPGIDNVSVRSSPPLESLNKVERLGCSRATLDYIDNCEGRIEKLQTDYNRTFVALMNAEDELREIVSKLPPRDQTLVIERYMQGIDLDAIAKKYYYDPDYIRVKFSRIYKKITKAK
ncbi:MAG: hypothetical protein WC966_10755 [Bradymonadales bacterium]